MQEQIKYPYSEVQRIFRGTSIHNIMLWYSYSEIFVMYYNTFGLLPLPGVSKFDLVNVIRDEVNRC